MEFNKTDTNSDFSIRDYQDLPAIMRAVVDLIENENVGFLYDGATMLVKRLKALAKKGKVYPLIAMTGWTETGETSTQLSVTIEQLIIASHTKKEHYSEERDNYNFKPVLLPVQNEFEKRLIECGYFVFGDSCSGIEFASRRREMFFGDGTEHDADSPIDAIVYEGIALTINKQLNL